MNPKETTGLDGKCVVVTGAGTGLGAEYARQIAAAGAAVVVNDLDPADAERTAKQIRAAGGEAFEFAADVSDWAAAGRLVGAAVEHFGGIDGLVNNAGIIGQVGSMLATDPESLARVLRVNVHGTAGPAAHAARAMLESGRGGAIVNVSSGNQSGHAGFASYGASKGAVSSLTYAWAAELGPRGIRVNAISPNAHTAMIDDLEGQLGSNPEARDYPSAADNAAVVVYLLSDRAARLNGQVVRVDHGLVSVTSHPAVVAPRVEVEYSPENVARIFEGELSDRLQPLGISLADIRHRQPLY
ncbi:SDR family NAD(P)-dependent oxidoreductase [Amycolatopsis jejuensis]|uniref:SDR family NAD(P)-dependent oxidoreductase n=1 Tax=Amycolatopsis jejuensis TaxID=330084 RepID=UPI00068C3445|nr:SDR family NAD(P)-dependent oxidoreductase [Amycolatopsis jejuensis]